MPQSDENAVQVELLSAGEMASMALGPFARHFGLNRAEAEMLLARGRGVFIAPISRTAARAALPVMIALGVRLALPSSETGATSDLHDLSLRLTMPDAAPAVVQRLQDLGFPAARDFDGPAGLELGNLTRSRADAVIGHLHDLPGVLVTASRQSDALYDVFAPKGLPKTDLAALLKHLSDLGCAARHQLPALGEGLDRGMLRHVQGRFAGLGLIGVNQAFQRYHLKLTGPGRLSPWDIENFLATRGVAVAQAQEALRSERGLRLETALTRGMARQFLSDYAEIGLQVRAELAEA